MRQRKVKHEAERLEAAKRFAVEEPKEKKGQWAAYARTEMGAPLSAAAPDVYLEMGCGRGQFLVRQALAHPDCFYVGAEGRTSIAVRCLELIQAGGNEENAAGGNDFRDEAHFSKLQEKLELAETKPIDNARCIAGFIDRVEDFFADGELSGVYCNFSDPWPKSRHEKRRLTSRNFLEGYRRALKPGGFIAIKTDNDALFAFTLSVLEELQQTGAKPAAAEREPDSSEQEQKRTPEEWRKALRTDGPYAVPELSFDLHRSDYEAKNVTTQYEDRFLELGVPIKYCRITFGL